MQDKLMSVLSIILVGLIANLAMLIYGFPLGHDSFITLAYVSEFRTALLDGQWPPYWSSNVYHGYGSPFFIYYGGVYPLVVSLLAMVFGGLANSCVWATVLFSGIGAWGVFLLAKSLLPVGSIGITCARLASYSFLLFPYLIGDIVARSANAEYTALCLAPYVFFGLVQLSRSTITGLLYFIPAMALVMYSHNLMSVAVLGVVAILVFVLYPPWMRTDKFFYAVAGVLVALLLSGFFWFPVWSMLPLVSLDNTVTGKFDFHNQFNDFEDYFKLKSFFSAGLLSPVLIVIGAWLLIADGCLPRNLRSPLTFLLFIAALCLFLLARSSIPVWEMLPVIRYFQFPWRFIGVLAVVSAIILAIVSYRWLATRSKSDIIYFEIVLLAMMLLQAFPVLSMYRSVYVAYSPVELEAQLTPESIRETGFREPIFPFFPKVALDAGVDVFNYVPPIERKVFGTSILKYERSGTTWHLRVQADQPTNLPLDIWAFPVVSVLVNGMRTPVSPYRDGTWSVQVSAGISDIKVMLHQPIQRIWGLWASAVGLLIYLALLAFQCRLRCFCRDTRG